MTKAGQRLTKAAREMRDSVKPDADAIDALAQAWASIDGKLDAYKRERGLSVAENHGKPGLTGAFAGYQAEAEEMIRRLRSRGFDVCPIRKETT